MAFEQKPNFGSLFKNDRKQPGDRLPDYCGTIALPDGTQMEISGWLKETAKGDKFLSLALKEPWQGGQKAGTKKQEEEAF